MIQMACTAIPSPNPLHSHIANAHNIVPSNDAETIYYSGSLLGENLELKPRGEKHVKSKGLGAEYKIY